MAVTKLILSRTSSKTKTIVYLGFAGIMLVVALVLGIQQRRSAAPVVHAKPLAEDKIYAQVGKHLALPDVRPSLSQVDDVAALQHANAIFYRDAQAGDWVLSFPTLVVLYRSSTDRVIFSMPVIK